MPEWEISSADASDIAAVLELWRAAGTPPGVSDSADGLRALLASDPDALLIAASEGRVIGSLIAVWDGWRGNLYRLAVDPRRRREGIATALLREGEQRLRRRGAVRLSALIAPDDPAAVAFWRAAGYRRQADRVRFLRHLDGPSAPKAGARGAIWL